MARTKIPLAVINATGDSVVGASVQVNNRPAGTAATVYAAETGATTVTNPLTTNTYGRVTGWMERGAYTAVISGSGVVVTSEDFDSAPGANAAIEPSWLKNYGAVVTALPSSPVDGEICFFQSSGMATDGIVWQLRYRSGGGTYKWEYVGGPHLYDEQIAAESASISASVWSGVSANDPTVTVPLGGDYDCHYGATLVLSVGSTLATGVKVASTEPTLNTSAALTQLTATGYACLASHRRHTGITAATVFQQRYYGSAGTLTREASFLSLSPVRVG